MNYIVIYKLYALETLDINNLTMYSTCIVHSDFKDLFAPHLPPPPSQKKGLYYDLTPFPPALNYVLLYCLGKLIKIFTPIPSSQYLASK